MLLLLSAAYGASTSDLDLVEQIRSGLVFNWTDLTVEVTESARGSGTRSSRVAVEQMARRKVQPGIEEGARALRVQGELTVEQLLEDPSLADSVASRITRWAVGETRYFSSGRVEIVGGLSSRDLLKPWVMTVSGPAPETDQQPRYTGLVIDARGTGLLPAYAPRVLAHDGTVLFEGLVWQEHAIDTAPVRYVRDPAHPAATRAGIDPLFVMAETANGTDIVLSRQDSIIFTTALRGAKLMGEGKVVVVADSL